MTTQLPLRVASSMEDADRSAKPPLLLAAGGAVYPGPTRGWAAGDALTQVSVDRDPGQVLDEQASAGPVFRAYTSSSTAGRTVAVADDSLVLSWPVQTTNPMDPQSHTPGSNGDEIVEVQSMTSRGTTGNVRVPGSTRVRALGDGSALLYTGDELILVGQVVS